MKPIWLVLGVTLFTGCAGTQPQPTLIPIPSPQIATRAPASPTPQQNAAPEPRPTQTGEPRQITQYTINAFLDYDLHQVIIEQEVRYTHKARTPLTELRLTIEANRRTGVFILEDLRWGDGQSIADAQLKETQLILSLPQALAQEESLSFTLAYKLILPPIPGPFGYTARQVNLTDWYAFVPPFDDLQGWLIHEPGNAGEHLVYDQSDFDIILRLSDPDLVVAGPIPPRILDTGFHYQFNNARTFALSISPEFQTLTTSVGAIPVTAYVFPEHITAGQASLEASSQALSLFSDLFGPFPYQSLSMVEIDFDDGLEADALVFLGQPFYERYDGTVQNYLTALTAHEVAHNWWFGAVGNDQAVQPWLDEALSTYSEYLYYERLYPQLAEWWWEFRILRFSPKGFVDSAVYDHPDFSPYVQAVYFRGALFLHELRSLIGDETFFAFIRAYAEEGKSQIMRDEDFFTLLEQFTAVDFEPLLSEYFAP